eukprot:m.79350 g.79350  ORF g.79350 m.79350 type:complete len:459 (+) comp14154_c0_seq1:199-1575(+)
MLRRTHALLSSLRGHRAVVLTGPTAIGKTDLSLRLAEELNGEIVSADSVQVYRGMDIGTDKVSVDNQQRVKHHLIDICSIFDVYSSGEFFENAMALCRDIVSRGKTPLIVGGTWFYLNFLLHGRPSAPKSNALVEDEIMAKYDREKDWDAAARELQQVDPESAARIDRNDWYRFARALSVYKLTGKPFSSFKDQKEPGLADSFDVTQVYLTAPRWMLFQRIDQRCEYLVQQGLMEETLRLIEDGLTMHMHAARSIGYRQSFEFLTDFWLRPSKKTSLMKRRAFIRYLLTYQAATRQLCAKQMRAFRSDPSYAWIVRDDQTTEEELLDRVFKLMDKESKPQTLGDWDRQLNIDNLKLLKGHLPEFEVFDEGTIDLKMNELEGAVVRTGRVMHWQVDHLHAPDENDKDLEGDVTQEEQPDPNRKATKGERRRNRWLSRTQGLNATPKKKRSVQDLLNEYS